MSIKALDSPGKTGTASETPPEDRSSLVARLFREHNRILIGFLFARLRNEQEAREIAQEAYVKLLRLDQAAGAASFLRSYLFRVAENLAIDRIRQRKARSRLDQLHPLDDFFEERTERAVLAEQELALLETIVKELPDKYRLAFRLVKFDDRPFADAAELMGISERMVRKYITGTLVYLRLRREGVSALDAWNEVQS